MAGKDQLQLLKDPNKAKSRSAKNDAVMKARQFRLRLNRVQNLRDDGPVAHNFGMLIKRLNSGNMPTSHTFSKGDFKETLCQFLQLKKPFLFEYWSNWGNMFREDGANILSRERDLDDLLLMFGRLARSVNSMFMPRVVQMIVDFTSARDNYLELSQKEAARLADEFVACWKLISTEIQLLSPEDRQNISWPDCPVHDDYDSGSIDTDGLDADEATEHCREVALEEYRLRLGQLGLMPPGDAPAGSRHPLAALSDSVKCLADEVERGNPALDDRWNRFDYKLLERLLAADTSLSYDCFEDEDGSDEAIPVGFCDEPTDEDAYKKQIIKDLTRYLAAACRLAKKIGSKSYDDLVICQERFDAHNGMFFAHFDHEKTSAAGDLKTFIKHFKHARPILATDCSYKTEASPIDARLVDVDVKSAGKGLRAAMKDPGGRPPKTHGGAKVMTQAEMATAFGSPCNESMVANWEARAAGKKRGANPPDALYNDERIIYSAELRLNPTPDNTKRLSALIAEFQSRHRIKEAIGKKALHMKSAETLAKSSGHVAAAIRDQSQLKYGK